MTTHSAARTTPIGLMLAAGRGMRFDPTCQSNKLRQRLSIGEVTRTVAQHAAHALCAALPASGDAVALIAVGCHELEAELKECGLDVLACPVADEGMGSVLAWATRQLPPRPLLVSLGDMPWLRAESIATVLAQMDGVMPVAAQFRGTRGHPVGFPADWLERLGALSGDRGAGGLLQIHGWRGIDIDDPGIVRDVDCPDDMLPQLKV